MTVKLAINALSVTNDATATGPGINLVTDLGGPVSRFENSGRPCFAEYYKNTFGARVTVGALGSIEANLSFNMDYTDGSHRLYDQAMSATWLAIGNAGTYLQYAPATAAGGDVWTAGGSLYNFEIVASTGDVTLRGKVKLGSFDPPNAAYAFEIKNATMAGVNQYGLVSNPRFSSGATTGGRALYGQVVTAAASFTMASAYGLEIQDADKGAGSTITTLYGLYVREQTQGATNWAIYLKSSTTSGGATFRDTALATGATVGHFFIPSSAGAPTGVPASIPTGQIAFQYDSTNDQLYVYNGSWRKTAALT